MGLRAEITPFLNLLSHLVQGRHLLYPGLHVSGSLNGQTLLFPSLLLFLSVNVDLGSLFPDWGPTIVWIEIVIVCGLVVSFSFFFFLFHLRVGTAYEMCFMKSTAESFKVHPLFPCFFFLPPPLAALSAGGVENKFGTHMLESTD